MPTHCEQISAIASALWVSTEAKVPVALVGLCVCLIMSKGSHARGCAAAILVCVSGLRCRVCVRYER